MSEVVTSGLRADLSGQVAIVTGASQGLGAAMAIELAANGALVVCVARNAEKLARPSAPSSSKAVRPRRSVAM